MPQVIALDSHIWFWWINLEHHRIPPSMLAAIESAPRVGVSPVSCFELALAYRRGRLELPRPTREWFALALAGSDVELLHSRPTKSLEFLVMKQRKPAGASAKCARIDA
jgi:PIN domain nuclease of toxin-antitoxin system